MNIFFSQTKNTLIYIGSKANSAFWDAHWNSNDLRGEILSGKNDLFVYPITKKFLKPSSSCRILEGGCGKARYVYSLAYRGYDSYGIDYAETTIQKIKSVFPELKVSFGDVRALPFENASFDGYWSLGVIEHFWDGYDAIADEMSRVIKDKGYLFLTFPHLSPQRKRNIRLARYPKFENNIEPEKFYQFALDQEAVQKKIESRGFVLKHAKRYDGLKGLLDGLQPGYVKDMTIKLYNSSNPVLRIFKLAISLVMAPWSGHIVLLVFQRHSKGNSL